MATKGGEALSEIEQNPMTPPWLVVWTRSTREQLVFDDQREAA
jgi:hypothetical protein